MIDLFFPINRRFIQIEIEILGKKILDNQITSTPTEDLLIKIQLINMIKSNLPISWIYKSIKEVAIVMFQINGIPIKVSH